MRMADAVRDAYYGSMACRKVIEVEPVRRGSGNGKGTSSSMR